MPAKTTLSTGWLEGKGAVNNHALEEQNARQQESGLQNFGSLERLSGLFIIFIFSFCQHVLAENYPAMEQY